MCTLHAQAASAAAAGDLQEQADDEERQLQAEVGQIADKTFKFQLVYVL